jgi:uncharacterized protein YoxC
MESVLVLLEIVALTCVSVLSVYLIVTLSKLNVLLGNIERDFRQLTSKALPVFENLEAITAKARSIAENINEEIYFIRESSESLRMMVDDIVDFERRVKAAVEEPIVDAIATFSGFARGLRTFLQFFRS